MKEEPTAKKSVRADCLGKDTGQFKKLSISSSHLLG